MDEMERKRFAKAEALIESNDELRIHLDLNFFYPSHRHVDFSSCNKLAFHLQTLLKGLFIYFIYFIYSIYFIYLFTLFIYLYLFILFLYLFIIYLFYSLLAFIYLFLLFLHLFLMSSSSFISSSLFFLFICCSSLSYLLPFTFPM